MQSFRTELEKIPNNAGKIMIEKDIIHLANKIQLYQEGKMDKDKFKSLRLARGIYGQRQQGVQMVRIKIPLGKINTKQLLKIADISDEYSTGNLHLTTRQDIQIHHVSLNRTPEIWAQLAQDDITIREACGNTVRNVTASPDAGINPNEPFDITLYAQATMKYLLGNPIQESMGRKFKIAFSSSDEDSALTFIHDLGLIPKVKIVDGKIVRGFKAVIGGGLGPQPYHTFVAHEFLPTDQIIPFVEAMIRVFDRYGERNNRHKARIKYLIAKIGIEEYLRLTKEEYHALKVKSYPISEDAVLPDLTHLQKTFTTLKITDEKKYNTWFKTNLFEQKQQGYYAVGIKISLGNIRSEKARLLAEVIKKYSADDFRVTVNQGFLLRFVPKQALPALYKELDALGLAEPGFDSVGDITACPGTDTCNLAISGSTGIAKELESVIKDEYEDLIYDKNLKIKISGCMNSCGQHGIAHIGFHGSSFKSGPYVVPALQLLLGGGSTGNGNGRFSDKITKVPSKRGPAVLRSLLDDFKQNAQEGEVFNSYFDRKGRSYFEELLKPHTDLSTLGMDDYKDWGYDELFKPAIGVGECAGVMIDLVATLFIESEEKLDWGKTTLQGELFADSIYHSYSTFINTAKGLLLTKEVPTNTQIGILNDFEKHFPFKSKYFEGKNFKDVVLQINQQEPTKAFAEAYLAEAEQFLTHAKKVREELLVEKV